MSFLSIQRQNNMPEDRFIGDLINLFNRHRIRCGDPQNLESFASDLLSRDALRSDLFTLCTAISHMADADLSGEQLLDLIARALGGAPASKGDGASAIPDSLRSAFLNGFEAWNKREPDDPLPWPPARQPAQANQPLSPSQTPGALSQPTSSERAEPALHTIREALEIARRQTPVGLPPHRASSPGASIEGLTLKELKSLLEDIEHRISRIQPHLQQLTSIVHSAPGSSGSSGKLHESEEIDRSEKLHESESIDLSKTDPAKTGPLKAVDLAAEPDAPLAVSPAQPAVVPMPAAGPMAAAGPMPTSVEPNDAAFLSRHPYLTPARHTEPHTSRAAAARATPQGPQPSPSAIERSQDTARQAYVSSSQRSRSSRPRVRPQAVIVAVGVLLLVILTSALAGVFLYGCLHTGPGFEDPGPTATVDQPSPPRQPEDPNAVQPPAVSPATPSGTDAQSPAASQKPELPADPPANSPGATPDSRGSAPAPAPTPAASAASSASRPAGVSNPTPATHPASPPAHPLFVPTATMMSYALSAPQPVYPPDQAKGTSGSVVLQVNISREGSVTSARALSGPIEMRPAAVQAMRAWRFKPYLLNGNPAEVTTTLEFVFTGQ